MKIAIIGTGNVAQSNYLPFLSKQEGIELIYYSRTEQKSQDCANRFGGTVITSLKELVFHEPDSIFILTREMQRAQVLQQLLPLQPKRIFCEKPLIAAISQSQVNENDYYHAYALIKAAREKNIEMAMMFNYRTFDQVQKAQKIVVDRNFGPLQQISVVTHYNCWSHCIDLLLEFAGPVETIFAMSGSISYDTGEMKDKDVSATMRFKSGAVGSLIGTYGTANKAPLYHIQMNFQKGSLHLRDLDGQLTISDDNNPDDEDYPLNKDWSRDKQYDASFQKAISAYLQSIRTKQPPPVPIEAGLRELLFEAALRKSLTLNTPIQVTHDLSIQMASS
ncbi:MAG: Gfo/Idh/MocA family oxidoreductase [Opitutaceae bacterium]|nr:Gfo/Idh/MocA family oxidoreductase [Opitutaceae bacterium]